MAALAVALLGTAVPANAQPKQPGGYYEIDFTAAEPLSYNHLLGGGAYDAGISNFDTVQSLEGKDFGCGDIVSFMTKISMRDSESSAYGATTLRLRYSWDMASTGSATGVGYADLTHAQINYGYIDDLLEPGSHVDNAIVDDGGSTATIHSETQTGPIWVSGSELVAEIDVNDLEAGETVVLQLDVKVKCDPTQNSSGNIQAQLDNTEVIEVTSNPIGATLPDRVNSGERTIPMKGAGAIHYPQVSLQKTVTTPTGSCATATDSIAISSGDQVKYCFAITNPSNVLNPPGRPLYQFRLKDDNGTPLNLLDDFWLDTSTISGLQDLDGLGQLNDLGPGVTVYTSILRTVTGTAGSIVVNTATAYGDDSVILPYTLESSDTAQVQLFVAAPAVAISKTTSGTTDSLPSDNPLMFAGEAVHWFYQVTNTGNVAVNSVVVTDNRGVTVTCPKSTLAIAESMTCTANGIAIAGTYTNTGTVVAHYNSETVTASDGSGYFGRNPLIDITKTPATQTVVAGGTATFTITVTNIGNVPLGAVSVSDALTPSCNAVPKTTLAVAESMTYSCTATGVNASFTNTAIASGTYATVTVTDTASAAVVVDFLPDISVTKTPSVSQVAETGAPVTFTVVVSSAGVDPFTLNSLTDNVFGDLNGKGTCSVPRTIAHAGSYSCAFTATVSGEPTTSHIDTVTASGVDPEGNPDTATASATVTFDDVMPDITVTKTPSVSHVSELGETVTFTVVVTNVNAEAVTLGALTDSVYGNLAGEGTCATGGTIAGSGGTYSCTFSKLLTGQPGTPHVDTVTAVASDNDGNSDTATASATVTFDDVMPDITVTKTPSVSHVSELGGPVTFTVVVTNHNGEAVTLTSLTDNVFGNLATKGTCATGGTIAGSGGTYSCSFTETFSGQPSTPHIDTVTAVASDNDGNSDTATASATVTFDDVMPDITVTKVANPTSVSELGGTVLFTVTVHNVNAEAVTLGTLTDSVFGNLHNQGTCVTGGSIAGGGTYICTFSKILSGQPSTPHVDTVTAVASDNDGNSDTATASATVNFNNVMPDITVVKTANPTTLPVSGGYVDYLIRITNVGSETVTITSFSDSRLTLPETCTSIITSTLVPGAHVDCVLASVWVVPDAGGDYINNATATGCDDDGYCDTDTGTATVVFNWYGRTPGYWKNHLTVWPTPYAPTTMLSTVFTSLSAVTAGPGKPQMSDTLLTALGYQGGSGIKGAAQILLRAATAALLNEQYYGSWYPVESIAWLKTQVNAALDSGLRSTMLTLATTLDGWNNGIEASMP